MITTRCRTATAVALVAFVVLSLLALAQPVAAVERPFITAERAAAATVLVREGDIVDEDLYAGGNRVLIEGTVQGDLTVAAFQELIISGTVEGDVVGYSPLVSITGTVGGSVRVAADVLRVEGEIGGDVFTGTRSTTITGTVGRDVQVWTLSLDVRARVGRDIQGRVFDYARIGGVIERDVELTVRDLEVLPGTEIAGSLGYRSGQEAEIAPDVEVGRALTRRDPVTPNVRVQAIWTLTWVLVVIAITGLGLLLFWLTPRTLKMAIESVQNRTFLSLVVGFLMVVVPLALFILVVVQVIDSSPELALPSAVIGLPIGLLLLGLLLFGLLVSPVPVLAALGMRLSRRRSALFGYFVGVVIWVVILVIPAVRVFVTVLLAILGLGAWTLGAVAARGRYEWAVRRPGDQTLPGAEELLVVPPVAHPTQIDQEHRSAPDNDAWPEDEIGEPFDPETMQLPFDEDD